MALHVRLPLEMTPLSVTQFTERPTLSTVNDVLDVYERDRKDPHARKPCRHPDSIVSHNKAARAALGHYTLAEANENTEEIQMEAERAWYDAGVSRGTVNKRISQLQSAFKCCVRKRLIKRDDEPFFQRPGQGDPRERVIDRETEWPKLRDALESVDTPYHLNTFVRLALGAMQRCGANLSLEWEMVDFGANTIFYKRTGGASNKRRVNVPMSEGLREHLEKAQKRARSKYVIEWRGDRVESVGKAFKALIVRAGLEDVRIHDLRRSGASWAFQSGVPLSQVAAMLGDNEDIVRRHYAHVLPDFLSNAADSVDRAMRGAA